MAGVPAGLPAGVRVSDHISFGVIAKTFPPDRVQKVLAETGNPLRPRTPQPTKRINFSAAMRIAK